MDNFDINKSNSVEEKVKRNKNLIISAVVLLIIIVVSFIFIVNWGDNVKMPKLIGKSVSEAESILKENGFINYSIDTYEKEDIIVEQSIKENVEVNNHDDLILKTKGISEIFEDKILHTVENIAKNYNWRIKLYNVKSEEIQADSVKDKKIYKVTEILNYKVKEKIFNLKIDSIKHLAQLEKEEKLKQEKLEESNAKKEEKQRKEEEEIREAEGDVVDVMINACKELGYRLKFQVAGFFTNGLEDGKAVDMNKWLCSGFYENKWRNDFFEYGFSKDNLKKVIYTIKIQSIDTEKKEVGIIVNNEDLDFVHYFEHTGEDKYLTSSHIIDEIYDDSYSMDPNKLKLIQ